MTTMSPRVPVLLKGGRVVVAIAFGLSLVAAERCGGILPAAAVANTLYVNTAAFGKSGTCVLGNDVYDATTATNNTCTLGAALTMANASTATPLTVTLATGFAASIPDGTQAMIMPNVTTTNWMNTTHKIYTGQQGAYYAATAPMTIDLQNKLGIQAISTASASVLLSGANITLRNASEIRNAGAAIAAAEGASNLLIEGGRTMPMDNNLTQRFLEIDANIAGLTFRDYTVGNLNSGGVGTHAAAVLIMEGASSVVDTNLLIDNVTFTTTRDPYSSTWTCTATDSSGCVNNSIVLAGARFNGLEIRNCLFKNLVKPPTAKDPVVFSIDVTNSSAIMEGLNFHNNTIVNSGSCKTQNGPNDAFCSLISLPGAFPNTSDNYIQNNTFINDPALGMPAAITWYGAQTATPATATKVHIQDNHFDGFQKSTIWLYNAGLVTMERNTFGPNTFSNATTATEETVSVGTQGAGAGMIVNEAATSNRKIATWHPTAATAAPTGCGVTITAASTTPVSPGTAPALPLRLDVFWTAGHTAEKFLGSSANVTSGTTASVTVTLPPEAYGPTGALTGAIRLQTQALEATQTVSSQFSRTLALSGTADWACTGGRIDTPSLAGGPFEGGATLTLTGAGLLGLASSGQVSIVFNGDAPGADVTVVDDSTLTCAVPPSTRAGSLTGAVSVTVLAGATVIADFPDGYVYLADGVLQLDKRAWTNVPTGLSGNALYAALLGSGHGGATEIPRGAVIQPGTPIVWTYTVTYVHLVGGVPYGGASDVALNQVSVADDLLGSVCTIPVLSINTSAGCVASTTASAP